MITLKELYTVRINKKVIHFQRPIVLSKLNWIVVCGVQVKSNVLILFPSCMSRMTEYTVIEDENVIFHFLQVLLIG